MKGRTKGHRETFWEAFRNPGEGWGQVRMVQAVKMVKRGGF